MFVLSWCTHPFVAHRRVWTDVWPKLLLVVICKYNNFIHLCPFVGFSYHIELLPSRMRHSVSLLTVLRYMELFWLLFIHAWRHTPNGYTVNCISDCSVIMFETFCDVNADTSNCHFKSRLVCVFVFVYVIPFNDSVCVEKLKGKCRIRNWYLKTNILVLIGK